MSKKRYRIIFDRYSGYEAQWRHWWSPIWIQCFRINTSTSIDRAKKVVQRHKNYNKPVWKD